MSASPKPPRMRSRTIDAAYHEKYDGYGANIVGHVTGPDTYPVTFSSCRREKVTPHE